MTRLLSKRLDPRKSWPAFLAISGLSLSLVFTALDPGVSDGVSGLAQLLFWLFQVFGLLATFAALQVGLARVPVIARLGPWPQIMIVSVLGSALFVPVAMILDHLFGVLPDAEEAGQSLAMAFLDEFAALAPPAALCWLALNAVPLLRLEAPLKKAQDRPQVPDFWSRVPVSLGRSLVALSAELHYMRVNTVQGDVLILYPFGKATDQVAAQGTQIHRSHWVADVHVAGWRSDGRKVILRLKPGLELPVSRSRATDIKTRFARLPGR